MHGSVILKHMAYIDGLIHELRVSHGDLSCAEAERLLVSSMIDSDDSYDPDYDDLDDHDANDPDFLDWVRIFPIERRLKHDPRWGTTYYAACQVLLDAYSKNETMHARYLRGIPQGLTVYETYERDYHRLYLDSLRSMFRAQVKQLVRMFLAHDPELPADTARKHIVKGFEIGAASVGMVQGDIKSIWGVLGNVRRPGRPRKAATTTPQRHRYRGRINLDLARRAYSLHTDGWHWTKIARALSMDEGITDPQERERIRKRVDRLIYRGRIEEGR
jgi:hypothetical protein